MASDKSQPPEPSSRRGSGSRRDSKQKRLPLADEGDELGDGALEVEEVADEGSVQKQQDGQDDQDEEDAESQRYQPLRPATDKFEYKMLFGKDKTAGGSDYNV